jgi:WD40 repeat protein
LKKYKTNNLDTGYDTFQKFALVDLEGRIPGKVMGNALGNEMENCITADFDGSIVFSLDFQENVYKLNCSRISLSKTKNNFLIQSCLVDLDDATDFKHAPLSLCFIESSNLLFLASREGPNYVYHVDFINNNHLKHTNLNHAFKFELPKTSKNETGEQLIIEMIPSFDGEYLITRTLNFRIFVFRVKYDQVILVKKYKNEFAIKHFSLSANGRYLAICGMFLNSIKRLDLSLLSKKSFGEGCRDYLKILRDGASKKGLLEAKKVNTVQDKAICYQYDSVENYIEFLVNHLKEKKLKEIRMKKEMTQLKNKLRLFDPDI